MSFIVMLLEPPGRLAVHGPELPDAGRWVDSPHAKEALGSFLETGV